MNYTPQTEVHLLSNVPFNFSYNNVMDFDTITEQTAYFLNKSKLTFEDLTHQRVNNNTINLEIAYEDLYDINYMMFQNDKIPGKWFYAFITKYDFVSPKVTRITYQIDVYQTWLFDMEWQTTYVEREHTKRFNTDGSPVINTLDEGLNYGSDYVTTAIKHYEQLEGIIWAIIVSKVSLQGIPSKIYGGSNVSNIPTPLYFYGVPISADGSNSGNFSINGTTVSTIQDLWNLFTTNPDFVGSIVSMYYTSYVPFVVSKVSNSAINVATLAGTLVNFGGLTVLKFTGLEWNTFMPTIFTNMYNQFPNYTESKLLMYPYSLIEITNFKGETFTLKMENMTNPDSYKNQLNLVILSSLGIAPKTAIIPRFYLNNTNFIDDSNTTINDISYGIIDNDVSDIPIIDDYTASYIQANKNSINTTNKYAMDNALRGVSQNNANNRLNNAILDKQQAYTESDMAIGALSNAMNLNFGGSVQSLYQGTKAYDLTEGKRAQMNLNNEFANRNLRINAEQSIGLTQAKLKDINNIPPTISNMGNNSLFSYGNAIRGVYICCKTIRPEYRTQLTNYFKMFGYKVNKLEIPNLKSRQNYNYIKTIDANIIGNIPSNDLSAIKGIFDKGVTIWHTDNVGDYSLSNNEV